MSEIIGTPVQVELVEASGAVVLEVTIPGPPGPGATTEAIQDAAAALFTAGGHTGIAFSYDDAGNRVTATVNAGVGSGTVTNVGLSAPTGFSVTGSPVTTTGTLALAFTTGYSLPTNASQANWDTAFTERRQWDGSATGLTAATGRTSLGLGGSAVLNVGTTTGTVAAGDHAHGNITNAGAIGSTAALPIVTTTGGVLTTGTFGTTSGTFCQGNDARLSDARTPTAHNQAWSTITGTPTTRSGYGITDAAANGAIGSSGLTMGTGVLLGRSTAGTGAIESISLGSGLSLSAGTLSVTAGGGNVSTSGTPVAGQVAEWATASTIQGVGTTGSGNYVRATSPTLVTPALGTPSSGTLTNCAGLPVAGITGWDAPPAIGGTTSAAGTFSALGATASLLLPGAAPSTPAAGHIYRNADTLRYRDSTAAERLILNASDNLANLSNAGTARTNLGLGGLATVTPGTGIATALAVNVGSAGAPVLFNGAGGTPSSLTLTNATGLPTSGVTAFAADVRAQVEAALVQGANVTITASGSGATRQLTIASTGGGGGGSSPGAALFLATQFV